MELTPDELRATQLGILDEVLAFCRATGLRHYLAYGTLLGAVRHRGYIPWDDDVDLMMPRSDYVKFCATFGSVDPWFDVQSPETNDAWPFPYAKVHDRRTRLVEALDLDVDCGVNVDIFPVDTYSSSRRSRWRQTVKTRTLLALLLLKTLQPRPGRHPAKAALLRAVKPALHLVDPAATARAISTAATSTGPTELRGGVLVGSYIWDVPVDALAVSPTPGVFEGRSCAMPADHQQVLTAMYGPDFMDLPPEGERQSTHRFVATWV